MKRYTVTVRENGDTFRAFNIKQVKRWIYKYKYDCANQDVPWQPHFDVTEEVIAKGECND